MTKSLILGREQMETDHWDQLTAVLRRHGIQADPEELRRLPHDVMLSERVLERLRRDHGDGVQQ